MTHRPGSASLRRLTLTTLGLLALAGVGAAPALAAPAAPTATAAPVTRTATTAPAGRLALVLPLRADTAGLARFATAVSTPGSPEFGRYESISWLADHFGARPAAVGRAMSYLRAHGATGVRLDRTGLFIDADLTPAGAAALFRTDLVRHGARAGAYATAAAAPTLPAGLAGTVSGVVGLDTRPLTVSGDLDRAADPAPGGSAFSDLGAPITRTDIDEGSGYMGATGTSSGCAAGTAIGAFTPDEYLDAYGFQPLQAAGTLGQGEKVALIEVDGFDKSDVQTFATCFGLHLPKIVGFRANATVSAKGLPPGGEATLDLETLDAAAPDLSQIDVYESSAAIASVLEALTAPLQNSGYKPEVISASLGLCEPEIREAIGNAGIADAESALEEAAASGISVLAASGDDGSADCVSGDSADSLPVPELAVNFPASSPYVTAVGGTNLQLDPANAITAQPVWNDDAAAPGAAGGGGRSTLFKRPSYQAGEAAVTLNARGLPDVAMLADIAPGYAIYCTADPDCVDPSVGETDPWQAVGGTSASTPLLAGGLALIDELLRQHEKQGLGLINPFLYGLGANATTAPEVFSDVTEGSNDVGPFIRSSGQPLGCCSATPGYDLASGWGSVNLAGLAVQALADYPAIVDVAQTVPGGQHPTHTGRIETRVTCSGACEIGAYARVTVKGAHTFTDYSGLYHLAAAGSKLVKIPLSTAQRKELYTAAQQHRMASATIVGAIVDPAGNVERRSVTKTLRLSR